MAISLRTTVAASVCRTAGRDLASGKGQRGMSIVYDYRAYGLRIRSAVPLPFDPLPEPGGTRPDVTVRLGTVPSDLQFREVLAEQLYANQPPAAQENNEPSFVRARRSHYPPAGRSRSHETRRPGASSTGRRNRSRHGAATS